MKKIARPSVFTVDAYLSDSRKDSGASSRSSMGCVWAYLHLHIMLLTAALTRACKCFAVCDQTEQHLVMH